VFSVLWLCAICASAADEAGLGFEQANTLYNGGKFAEAAAAYDKLISAGSASGAVYYNRGNALFKLGQMGRAIASYRQALWLTPRDTDLRFNLKLARIRARGGTSYQDPFWRSMVQRLTVNEWTLITAAAGWLLFALLALEVWRPAFKGKLRGAKISCAVAVLFFGLCLGTALNLEVFSRTAIVITGEADVRNGPLEESPSVFKVRDGIELEVVDEKDEWLQVVDSAQRTGWLRRDQVLIFDPLAIPGAKS
jgi:tetratricopeptide (TPR) repeat protein